MYTYLYIHRLHLSIKIIPMLNALILYYDILDFFILKNILQEKFPSLSISELTDFLSIS